MIKEIECIITGGVQAVLFRDFVRRNAEALGLFGIVENLDDGSVRVVAQGDEDKLKELIELLSEGPPLAKVDNVVVEWREPKEQFTSFEIHY